MRTKMSASHRTVHLLENSSYFAYDDRGVKNKILNKIDKKIYKKIPPRFVLVVAVIESIL